MRAPTTGIVMATVVSNKDPDGQGRIEVRFPWMGKDSPTHKVSVASIMAGDDSGFFAMPPVGAECLVAFDQGDFDHGFVVGFTWNPQQPAPSKDERERMLRSRNGHTIRFLDSTVVNGNKGALIIEDGHKNKIIMTNGLVRIISKGHMDLQAETMTIMNRPVNPMSADI